MQVSVDAMPDRIMGIAPGRMRKKNGVIGGTETVQAEDMEKKTYGEPGQCRSSANFLSALLTKELCGLIRV
jgi:hypothetical protein